MSQQTALFTIALLLTFMSTQVIHTSAAEPSSTSVTTQKSKSKSKNAKHHSHKPRKHNTTGPNSTKSTNKKQ